MMDLDNTAVLGTLVVGLLRSIRLDLFLSATWYFLGAPPMYLCISDAIRHGFYGSLLPFILHYVRPECWYVLVCNIKSLNTSR